MKSEYFTKMKMKKKSKLQKEAEAKKAKAADKPGAIRNSRLSKGRRG